MDLDPVDIVKLCLACIITKLILYANSPIFIKLAPEVNMIGLLNPQIITGCQSMKHSSRTIIICYWSCSFHT